MPCRGPAAGRPRSPGCRLSARAPGRGCQDGWRAVVDGLTGRVQDAHLQPSGESGAGPATTSRAAPLARPGARSSATPSSSSPRPDRRPPPARAGGQRDRRDESVIRGAAEMPAHPVRRRPPWVPLVRATELVPAAPDGPCTRSPAPTAAQLAPHIADSTSTTFLLTAPSPQICCQQPVLAITGPGPRDERRQHRVLPRATARRRVAPTRPCACPVDAQRPEVTGSAEPGAARGAARPAAARPAPTNENGLTR